MKYLILFVMIGFVIWHFKKPSSKLKIGFQDSFILNPEELIVSEWEIYIPPQQKQAEERGLGFFEGEKVLNLIQTNGGRFALINSKKECYLFDSTYWPTFIETDKKSSLPLFARVATSKVLEVKLPESDQVMQWHIPNEVASILLVTRN